MKTQTYSVPYSVRYCTISKLGRTVVRISKKHAYMVLRHAINPEISFQIDLTGCSGNLVFHVFKGDPPIEETKFYAFIGSFIGKDGSDEFYIFREILAS